MAQPLARGSKTRTSVDMETASNLFALATDSVAGVDGARFLHVDSLFYAFKMRAIKHKTKGGEALRSRMMWRLNASWTRWLISTPSSSASPALASTAVARASSAATPMRTRPPFLVGASRACLQS